MAVEKGREERLKLVVAAFQRAFPDEQQDLEGVANRLEIIFQRGPSSPLKDQSKALIALEQSLKTAIRNYEGLQGNRRLFLNSLSDLNFVATLQAMTEATSFMLKREERRGPRDRKTNWTEAELLREVIMAWRDIELKKEPPSSRRKVPQSINDDNLYGSFAKLVSDIFNAFEINSKPRSALDALKREFPEFAESHLASDFTNLVNEE
ncbi:hypothetical protein MWU53_15795 [Aliiroseovarius sp. S1123]|jgi:hypothetical protein|uniref:hypothetical protein n=1 Tax=Aliiroseovarius sp. S1123 TaxID=2926404 RepID=UPI001FF53086|nr:hypothetical protein [Aliiroseovarius sp. S1123]MCK0172524.1 hypothetical protein [Aliiroseovarius sp. S1123]